MNNASSHNSLKIKIPDSLIIVNFFTLLLIASIFVIRLAPLRFLLGLPLLVFFPGYTLLRALFVKKGEIDTLECIGISGAMSVAITALIGFVLNYTTFGVRLEPAVASIAAFIVMISIIAFTRQAVSSDGIKWWNEFNIDLPARHIPAIKKKGYFILGAILFAVVALSGYTANRSSAKETFTEFYVLGLDGKAVNYPLSFVMESGNVTRVSYDTGNETSGRWGKVSLVVANHESSTAVYSIKIRVDGQPAELFYGTAVIPQLDNIRLDKGDIWTGDIGFAPLHSGINQKAEFLLFKDGKKDPEASLTIWVNAEERMP